MVTIADGPPRLLPVRGAGPGEPVGQQARLVDLPIDLLLGQGDDDLQHVPGPLQHSLKIGGGDVDGDEEAFRFAAGDSRSVESA
ncbi:hypothetical protein DUY81_00560 [Acidipropionibacterium acidipropionici]|uniref:Uncharacterized protein n=1 Tax=Acidipropionibacterium acidipropionici TaxID=1748 RepID=A0AAC9ANT0_9ACTN|nr:hypothetical protein AXH35_11190 [Acidipropionibacterium acidipropionici]AOZ47382.1 hypothetical protein A8L58_12635 [Acidipropionibacterium acidipropionici]AZP36508.1 hypothetical protein DUY81_00560 [Acidipropionibacterium acidipropionici]